MDPSLHANFDPWQWLIPPFLPEHGCRPLPASAIVEKPNAIKLKNKIFFMFPQALLVCVLFIT
ncbi:hypothetical protein [Acinetobacter bohemicus]|jgi:hypothetical protein|uniref:hypothetical protein n=1 Tax=Acinetobacter bohemicus TaxID=1435036 RepID=UPI00147838D4|nr:hypothetical protein [Acinetobacter bohemicus]